MGRELLNDREVYAIIELVEDRGWKVYQKRTQARLDSMEKSLLTDPSQERKERLPDDYLRGQIEALRWSLLWPVRMAEQRHELEDEESTTRRQREAADLLARLGPTFPGAGQGLPEA